jgi:uncharacterized protein (UPF0276 family)
MTSEITTAYTFKPKKAGLGLRDAHYDTIQPHLNSLGFLEIHPENYFGAGAELKRLDELADLIPITFHGVGLSLGSSQGLSIPHLRKLRYLIDKFKPMAFSEHIAWSVSGNAHMPDLLPLPYSNETLEKVSDNIKLTQDFLGREILVENPSTYLRFKSTMSEDEFMSRIVEKTGCRILFDVNNLYVNSVNFLFDPYEYIDNLDAKNIGQIHLAGHSACDIDGKVCLIDTHSTNVAEEVWRLYEYTLIKKGTKPTLLEWDSNLPPIEEILLETQKATDIMNNIDNKKPMEHYREVMANAS